MSRKRSILTEAAAALAKQGDVALANKLVKLTVEDPEQSIRDMLKYIRETAAGGHSFTVVVDPDCPDYTKKFGIDGDGATRIHKIEVEDLD